MSTAQTIANASAVGSSHRSFVTIKKEIGSFFEAILNPRQIMQEIEGMLLRQADSVEASDPERASTLRMQARRIWMGAE